MDSNMYWHLFLNTGAPEAYLLYSESRRMEESHVSYDQGTCASGDSI